MFKIAKYFSLTLKPSSTSLSKSANTLADSFIDSFLNSILDNKSSSSFTNFIADGQSAVSATSSFSLNRERSISFENNEVARKLFEENKLDVDKLKFRTYSSQGIGKMNDVVVSDLGKIKSVKLTDFVDEEEVKNDEFTYEVKIVGKHVENASRGLSK